MYLLNNCSLGGSNAGEAELKRDTVVGTSHLTSLVHPSHEIGQLVYIALGMEDIIATAPVERLPVKTERGINQGIITKMKQEHVANRAEAAAQKGQFLVHMVECASVVGVGNHNSLCSKTQTLSTQASA